MSEYILSGGYLMIPLMVCSLLSMTVVLERLYFWLRLSINENQDQLEKVLGYIVSHRSLPPTIPVEGKLDLTASLLIHAGNTSKTDIGTAFKLKVLQKIEEMNKGMMVLNTIISLAPLLGILGTVVGIIDSFDAISQLGTNSPQAVSGGISKALVTTAAGLSLSIITLVPYNYFNTRVRLFVAEAERVATQLLPMELKNQSNAF